MEDDDVVICGIAGRFPQSANVEEFWENLVNGVDMVTQDDQRWPQGYAGIPKRKGTLKNSLEDFDAEFFNVSSKQAERFDPQLRQLLEVSWEAVLDGGVNPSELAGRPVGVFVGVSSHETFHACRSTILSVSRFDLIGSTTSMLANRLSYFFDIRGPSFTMDTYCSSSLLAVHEAVMAIRSGECEGAIVAGVNLLLDPLLTLQIKEGGVLSEDGKCKTFDAGADGYVRSEAIVSIFITKRSLARRSYATVVHTKTNADGYKENGVTFPSATAQTELMRRTYEEAGIAPRDVFYVEAHGTGTAAGDGQELEAMASVFCEGRTGGASPLLIGSTKSNMGHSESASSLCAVVKVLLSIQRGTIPGNLHYSKPSPLLDGRLKVVTEATKIIETSGAIFGVCASGVGGSNVHVILKSEGKAHLDLARDLPALVPFSSRTREGVEQALQTLVQDGEAGRIELLRRIYENRTTGHEFRGFGLAGPNREISSVSGPLGRSEQPPLWFIFPGMGTQWTGMGREIMRIDLIRSSIEKSADILLPFEFDLIDLLVNKTWEEMKPFLSLAAIAIGVALIDFVQSLNLTPDGLIGHSAGEWLCAYADGCWSRTEVIHSVYQKDLWMSSLGGDHGMVSAGLTWEEAVAQCPPSIYPACHNATDNVTLAGPVKELNQFVRQLKERGIFTKEVDTGGMAFHSPHVAHIAPTFEAILGGVMEGQRARSSKWISTSVPEADWDTPAGKFFSPAYVVNNFVSPVLFHSAVSRIPPNAVVLEIGSHSLFYNILNKTLPTIAAVIPLMKRDADDNIRRMYRAVGSLFLHGLQPQMRSLYPPIGNKELLAGSSKSSISSLVQYNHSQKHPLLNYLNNSGGEHVTKVSLVEEEWEFLKGHQIDGRVLFPATGYLVLVWKYFGSILGKHWNSLGVQFENVEFHRATVLSPETHVQFSVKIFENSGDFQLCESGTVVASGKIRQLEEVAEDDLNFLQSSSDTILKTADVYKDFRLRGYEYSGMFKGILSTSSAGDAAWILWQGEWISFLDTLLQTTLVSFPLSSAEIYLPTGFKKVTIDPTRFSTFENGAGLGVSYSPERKLLSAPGISFEGLKFTSTARKRKAEVTPCLQRLEFVPYNSGNVVVDFDEALKVLVDIVLENVSRKTLGVNLAFTSGNESTSILIAIRDIIQSCPKRQVSSTRGESDLVVFQKWNDFEDFMLMDKGLRENEFSLVVSEDLVSEPKLKSFASWNLVSTLKTGNGFIQLLRVVPETVNSEIVIEIHNSAYNWLSPLKKAMNNATPSSRIWLVTSEPDSGLLGLVNCLRQEIGGDAIRCLMGPKPVLTEQLKRTDLVMNVFDLQGNLGSYRGLTLSQKPTTISEHAYLNVLNKGDLSSVTWIQAPPPSSVPSRHDRIPVTVYYAPLNFRDIMLAVGKLSADALPGDIGRSDCVLGLEFVGTDHGGRRVMGVVPSKGLATHVEADPLFSWTVPGHWSMEEAATVPIAYSTAYYALILRGRIQRGDSVLITSGTGGVGQAAIAIAQSFDCEIFSTVGSEEKKCWLLERFPKMKGDHVLSSGSTKFAAEILRLTENRGVDLVLNSLAQEKLQAALTVVANGGRFLEIGKFDLSQNTPLGMNVFLRNISFHGILTDSLFSDTERVKVVRRELHELLVQGIQTGVVQPLPSTLFEQDQAEEAFRFMASGKHIGKVLIRLRSEDSATPTSIPCLPRTYFHPQKVYVLIGGLGGFGLEMASWFVTRGARILILCSRTGVRNGYQQIQIRRWREAGVLVVLRTDEMDTLPLMETSCHQWMDHGPIGGIFNLAMVLRDNLIENQGESDFEIVTQPKRVLTSLLDQVTRKLCPDLDHFVGFSSVSSVVGNEGQSNYGLGNSSLERTCEKRRRDGFPGLAIAWGAIGDVGVVHELMSGDSLIGGTLPQPLTSCLQVLDTFLSSESKGGRGILSSFLLPKCDEETVEMGGGGKAQMNLRQKMGRVLGLTEEGFESKKELTLGELGLDSLMMAEAKEILSGFRGGQSLSMSEIRKLTWVSLAHLEPKSVSKT